MSFVPKAGFFSDPNYRLASRVLCFPLSVLDNASGLRPPLFDMVETVRNILLRATSKLKCDNA